MIELTPPLKENSKDWTDFSFSKILSAYSLFYKECTKKTWGNLKVVVETYRDYILKYSTLLEDHAVLIYEQHLFLKTKSKELISKLKSKMAMKDSSDSSEQLSIDDVATNANFKDICGSELYDTYLEIKEGLMYFDLKHEDDFVTLFTNWMRPILLRRL